MAQRLIEMRYLKDDDGRKRNQVVAVTRMEAGVLEARAVAVRVRPPHAKQKPITSAHSVTKGD